jgi:hypothetical protein
MATNDVPKMAFSKGRLVFGEGADKENSGDSVQSEDKPSVVSKDASENVALHWQLATNGPALFSPGSS